MLSNWKNFKWPGEPLDRFTRHEPFPSEELKATYITGLRKPRKRDTKAAAQALADRWRKAG